MEIVEFTKEQMEEIAKYYDPLPMGVCIQKYLETEDGLGDFVPVYCNDLFAASLGIPKEFVTMSTLRQVSQGFPAEKMKEMMDIALHGAVVSGNSFSADYKRYFKSDIYQYAYGYEILFMTDITSGFAQGKAMSSVATSYTEIYNVQIEENICIQLFLDEEANPVSYQEFLNQYIENGRLNPTHKEAFLKFLNLDTIKEKLSPNEVFREKFQMKNSEGVYTWFLFEVISSDIVNNVIQSFTITVKDVDELVRQEREKQRKLEEAVNTAKFASESKNLFLKHMSHDLRTPLNGILGLLQLMEDNLSDANQVKEYINEARGNAHTLLEIFKDILNLTYMDSEGTDVMDTIFDFRQVDTHLLFDMKKIPFPIRVESKEFVYPVRKSKDVYIRQILLQIFENAIKFNKENGEIVIRYYELEDPTWVAFEIKDNGIGMNPDFVKHLFEPFMQEKDDARTKYSGSGLGLTYAKKLVDKLGGEITVTSEKNVGSCFIVKLPLTIVDEKEIKSKGLIQADSIEAYMENKKVLVVEDNRVNMMVIKKLLEKNKLIVETAENGLIGVEKFSQSKLKEYDFVLMDIMMPVMDGLEAAKNIRELDRPDAKKVPIIAVSANTMPEDISDALAAGMNDHIAKPIDMKHLLYSMNKYHMNE